MSDNEINFWMLAGQLGLLCLTFWKASTAVNAEKATRALHESVAANLNEMARLGRVRMKRMEASARRQEKIQLVEVRRKAINRLLQQVQMAFHGFAPRPKGEILAAWGLGRYLFSPNVTQIVEDMDTASESWRQAEKCTAGPVDQRPEYLAFRQLVQDFRAAAADELSPLTAPPRSSSPSPPTA